MDPAEQNAIRLDQEAMEIKEDPDRQKKKYNEAWAAYMSSFEAFEVGKGCPAGFPSCPRRSCGACFFLELGVYHVKVSLPSCVAP
jgi:hypothetical protein